ncbi:MAG: hypothetical protein ACYS8W_09000 [Planctomycetota bacterium]|jgi:hypothetical protein
MGIIKYIITIVLVPVVLFLIYLGYKWYSTPPKTGWNYPTLTAVKRAVDTSLEKVKDTPEPYKVVLVEPVLNDSEKQEALNYLVKSLDNSPRFSLLPQRVNALEKEKPKGVVDVISELAESFFGTEKEKEYLEIQGFDGYLVLDLIRSEDDEEASASVKLRYVPAGSGADKAEILGEAKQAYEKSYANYDYLSHLIQEKSWFGRFFIWLIVALVLPWVSYPISLRVLKMNSNRANAFLIIGMTAVSFIAGFILMGLTFGGLIWFIALLGATVLAAFWATATLLFFEEKSH